MSRPPIRIGGDGPLFVGYLPPPDGLRRGLLLGAMAAVTGAGVAGGVLAAVQGGASPGTWDQGALRTWTGRLSLNPYPMLTLAGEPRAALIGCPDKCGVADQVAPYAGQMVQVTGTAIRRDGLLMIAAPSMAGWIRKAEGPSLNATANDVEMEEITLEGEIMDAKCWLGAMRPGEGLTHKGCAELCVRGGLPLLFVAGPAGGRRRAFLATAADGGLFDTAVLPFVADPVRVSGALASRGGWPSLALDPASIRRL